MKHILSAPVRYFGRCFLAGVFALLPVIITVAVIIWVANFVERFIGPDSLVGQVLRRLGTHFAADLVLAYLIGALIVLAAVFVTGVFVEAGARNLVQRLTAAVFSRIPIVGSIYGTSQQLVSMLEKKDHADLQ